MYVSVNVHCSTIPSLIGIKGRKVKDIEKLTGTKIKIPKKRDGNMMIGIDGNDKEMVYRAKDLINIAIKHHEASLAKRQEEREREPGIDESKADLRTFYSEIEKMKNYV